MTIFNTKSAKQTPDKTTFPLLHKIKFHDENSFEIRSLFDKNDTKTFKFISDNTKIFDNIISNEKIAELTLNYHRLLKKYFPT